MPAAFPGPYTDLSLTQGPPFSQVSTAVRPMDPKDNGLTRVYMADRSAAPYLATYQSQPKPPQLLKQFALGSDPYKE